MNYVKIRALKKAGFFELKQIPNLIFPLRIDSTLKITSIKCIYCKNLLNDKLVRGTYLERYDYVDIDVTMYCLECSSQTSQFYRFKQMPDTKLVLTNRDHHGKWSVKEWNA